MFNASHHLWAPLSRIEDGWDALRRRVLGHRDAAEAAVHPYFGFGNRTRAHVRARVLQGRAPDLPHPAQVGPAGDRAIEGDGSGLAAMVPPSRTQTLRTMWRRFETDEIAGARVLVGETHETVSDGEGYVDLVVPLDATRPGGPDPRWRGVTMELPASPREDSAVTAPILVPGEDARFAIISDIDDTIVETHATDKLRMIPLVLTRPAAARTALPGVAALYKALEHGGATDATPSLNPVFYVSSSPWNLYDLLVNYMALQSIPLGPIFLRDYGLTRHGPIGEHHEAHKGRAIKTLMDTYPDLGFVLIGDSGQRDPQVYADAARDFPGRVRAVYLRDVSASHGAKAAPFVARLEALGVPTLLTADSVAMARHAAERGLIYQDAVAKVERALREAGS